MRSYITPEKTTASVRRVRTRDQARKSLGITLGTALEDRSKRRRANRRNAEKEALFSVD
jgi:hypothetical protein